jgi:hypothetical protein
VRRDLEPFHKRGHVFYRRKEGRKEGKGRRRKVEEGEGKIKSEGKKGRPRKKGR